MKESIEILMGKMASSSCRSRVKRSELAELFGSDRAARKVIESAQYEGNRIISGYGSGYWVAKDDFEYMAWRRRELARAFSILRKISAMDRMKDEEEQVNVCEYIELITEAERVANV